MLKEAGVFNGEHRVFHHLRNFLDRREIAPLLTVLAQQGSLGGEHPQRKLGAVVRQVRHIGKVWVGNGQRYGDGQSQAKGGSGGKACAPKQNFQNDTQPSAACASFGRFLLRGLIGRGGRHIAPNGCSQHYKNADTNLRSGTCLWGLGRIHCSGLARLRMLRALKKSSGFGNAL